MAIKKCVEKGCNKVLMKEGKPVAAIYARRDGMRCYDCYLEREYKNKQKRLAGMAKKREA